MAHALGSGHCCNAVWQLFCFTMDRTAEAGKSKGGGVCFMTNKKWCDPRNIFFLSRSCSPHLEHLSIICRPFYLPHEFSAVIVTAAYIPPQADTGLALSKLHDVLSGYIKQTSWRCFIIAGDFNKANLRQVMPNFHQHVSCPTRGRIHWIIATLSLRMPTKPAHYRLLANRTTLPFSSHRNINKGSHRNPRWRRKWRVGPSTRKLCCRRLLMTSTGTCSGELIWRQRVHGCSSELCKHTYRTSYRTITVRTFPNQKPWVDRTIRDAVNKRTAAYNEALLSGNMSMYKALCYALRRAVSGAKHRYKRELSLIFSSMTLDACGRD